MRKKSIYKDYFQINVHSQVDLLEWIIRRRAGSIRGTRYAMKNIRLKRF